jgi:acetyl esterase/lipase/streptogramin lyase
LLNVTSRIEVGPNPWSVVSAGGSIWVGNDLGVARVDPGTNQVAATVPLGGIGDVAADGDDVWVASYTMDQVGRVDLATNTVPDPVHVEGPSGLAIGGGAVWVVSPVAGSLTRIDPTSGTIVATIAIAEPAPGLGGHAVPLGGSVAIGAGGVWATAQNSGQVVRVDIITNEVVATFEAGPYPSMAFADGAVWVSRDDEQTLRRIDPATNEIVATIPLGATPYAVSAVDGTVWVTGDGMMAKIDTSTNTVSERLLATDGIYTGLAIEGADLWVARLATISSIGSYDPDVELVRAELGSTSSLPVQVIRGVPYTKPVPCHGAPYGACTLEADVYSRAGATHQPVIVLAHGGTCAGGCRDYLSQLASALSLEGVVVFNVDYRAVWPPTGGRATRADQDLACAIRFARANADLFGGDPGRITLVGHSAGGTFGSTVALGGDHFKGGCLAKGSGSPDAFVGLSGSPAPDVASFVGENRDLTFRYVVGSAEESRLIDKMREFVRTLKGAGYDATFTLVEGADHFSLYTPGSASPTLKIISEVSRSS